MYCFSEALPFPCVNHYCTEIYKRNKHILLEPIWTSHCVYYFRKSGNHWWEIRAVPKYHCPLPYCIMRSFVTYACVFLLQRAIRRMVPNRSMTSWWNRTAIHTRTRSAYCNAWMLPHGNPSHVKTWHCICWKKIVLFHSLGTLISFTSSCDSQDILHTPRNKKKLKAIVAGQSLSHPELSVWLSGTALDYFAFAHYSH